MAPASPAKPRTPRKAKLMYILLIHYTPATADLVPYDQSRTHFGGVFESREMAEYMLPQIEKTIGGDVDEVEIFEAALNTARQWRD